MSYIESRFNQPGYKVYSQMESLLVSAANNKDYSEQFEVVCSFLGNDIDNRLLQIQLGTFSVHLKTSISYSVADINTIKDFFKNLSPPQREVLSEVVKVIRIILVAPATNAVSERSGSALRRVKTWLRTTMSQERLNHCLILHVHKSLTDKIDLVSVATEFVYNKRIPIEHIWAVPIVMTINYSVACNSISDTCLYTRIIHAWQSVICAQPIVLLLLRPCFYLFFYCLVTVSM